MHIDAFGALLRERGLVRGSGVPCSFFTPLVDFATHAPDIAYVPATSEGEAVCIAAGMCAGAGRAFVLMQNSGLGNAVNPITSLLRIYDIPVALFVSRRGAAGDEPQHEIMGRITREMLELCGVRTHAFDGDRFVRELEGAAVESQPAAWIFEHGALTGTSARTVSPARPPVGSQDPIIATPVATREEVLRALIPLLDEPAVISTTGKLSRELYELADRPNRFYLVGSMGGCAPFALGVVRVTRRQVVALDGDGALLMKLGALATIGWEAPAGLHHVVVDNHAHDSTGGQPTASAGVDLAAVAAACGYRRVATVTDPEDAHDVLKSHLAGDGPTFLRVVVRTGSRADLGRPTIAPKDVYRRFEGWLCR